MDSGLLGDELVSFLSDSAKEELQARGLEIDRLSRTNIGLLKTTESLSQLADQQAKRIHALEAEKAAAAKAAEELKQQLAAQSAEAAETKQARDQQAERVKALEAEKVAAAKAAEELKQQLAAQSAEAAETKQARDQQAERVKALEAELAQQTGNLAAMAEALQRLRQLAMRPTS
jgi:chromosome segregation ATPase